VFSLGGMGEILVVLILALIFVGPEKLPDLATRLGKIIRDVRRTTGDLRNQFEQHTEIAKPLKEIRSALYDDVAKPLSRAGTALTPRRAPIARPALPPPKPANGLTAPAVAEAVTPAGSTPPAVTPQPGSDEIPTLRPRRTRSA
jgi:sec-independent protein translocase protein TatB